LFLGWICIPKNIHQFFFIKSTIMDNSKTYWPLQNEYWMKYDEIIRGIPYNEEQMRLLEYIAMLSNHLIQKDALPAIKLKKQTKPELFMDRHVFFNVLMMMTFYRFTYENRRQIYQLFDKFLSSPNIFMIMDSNQCFSCDII